jgi:hypothetical protein
MCRPGSKTSQLLAALCDGPARTARLSERTGIASKRIASVLAYTTDKGLTERRSIVYTGRRPTILWALSDPQTQRINAAIRLLETNGYEISKPLRREVTP